MKPAVSPEVAAAVMLGRAHSPGPGPGCGAWKSASKGSMLPAHLAQACFSFCLDKQLGPGAPRTGVPHTVCPLGLVTALPTEGVVCSTTAMSRFQGDSSGTNGQSTGGVGSAQGVKAHQ